MVANVTNEDCGGLLLTVIVTVDAWPGPKTVALCPRLQRRMATLW